MTQCPFCQKQHIANTIFCDECGVYLLEAEVLETDPLEGEEVGWLGIAKASQAGGEELPAPELLTIRLRVGTGKQTRVVDVSLVKPVRLGRNDPGKDIYPEIALTDNLARKYGVSRMHVCFFQRDNAVLVEDLGSINGTLLNGQRLAPYVPALVKDGDLLELGKLLVEVSLVTRH